MNARARELVCILQFTSYISSYLVVFRWISPRKSMRLRLSLISQTETSQFSTKPKQNNISLYQVWCGIICFVFA